MNFARFSGDKASFDGPLWVTGTGDRQCDSASAGAAGI
jgi:hypothetical protein